MVKLVLFDIDGTLVHTGHAGTQAFARTFATEFNAHGGLEKMKFAGRTDVSLVREFFKHNDITATPENFRRFFDSYIFWLDQILARSKTEICPGVWELLRDLRALPKPPIIGLLTGNIGSARKSSCAILDCGNNSSSVVLPTITKNAISSRPPHMIAATVF